MYNRAWYIIDPQYMIIECYCTMEANLWRVIIAYVSSLASSEIWWDDRASPLRSANSRLPLFP